MLFFIICVVPLCVADEGIKEQAYAESQTAIQCHIKNEKANAAVSFLKFENAWQEVEQEELKILGPILPTFSGGPSSAAPLSKSSPASLRLGAGTLRQDGTRIEPHLLIYCLAWNRL